MPLRRLVEEVEDCFIRTEHEVEEEEEDEEDEKDSCDNLEAMAWHVPSSNNMGHSVKDKVVNKDVHLLLYAASFINVVLAPYGMLRHGVVYLLTYILGLLVIGLPGAILETSLGMCTKQSTVEAFRAMHTRWTGVGVSACLACVILAVLFTVLIGYSGVYLVVLCTSDSQWEDEPLEFWSKVASPTSSPLNGYLLAAVPTTFLLLYITHYFSLFPKALCYLLPFPLALLVTLTIRSTTLSSGIQGIEHLFRADASLFDTSLWGLAVGQALVSIGAPGSGNLITFSRSLEDGRTAYKAFFKVIALNVSFTTLCAVVVGGGLGHLIEKDKNIESAGLGVAFVGLCGLLKEMGTGRHAVGFMLFGSLVLSGVGCVVVLYEGVLSVIDSSMMSVCRPFGKGVRGLFLTVLMLMGSVAFIFTSDSSLLNAFYHHTSAQLLPILLLMEYVLNHDLATLERTLCFTYREVLVWKVMTLVSPLLICGVVLVSVVSDIHEGRTTSWLILVLPLVPTFVWFVKVLVFSDRDFDTASSSEGIGSSFRCPPRMNNHLGFMGEGSLRKSSCIPIHLYESRSCTGSIPSEDIPQAVESPKSETGDNV